MNEMDDIHFMRRALQLAALGGVDAAPNPMVGAVIVHNDIIIGEGYHRKCGEAHAEVNAVASVDDKLLLSESTMYVTLEPCAHHGKTPPCADLLVRYKFKRVVIACVDTFSEVAGRGIERLKENGIEVIVGVLEDEARNLNKRFFCFHERKRPYVILKWAQTKDGFIDRLPTDRLTGVNWITQPETRLITHQWRASEQAILVGWRTIQNDDPTLNVREVEGKSPHRYVLDPNCSSNPTSKVYTDGYPTTVFVRKNKFNDQFSSVDVIELQEDFSLETILHELYKRNHISVFVEGGKYTLQQFLDASIWDEAHVFIGDARFEKGVEAPHITIQPLTQVSLGKDQLFNYVNV